MTSLFEQGTPGSIPQLIVTELVETGARAVSLLEFFAVEERPHAPKPVEPKEAIAESTFVVDERAAQLRAMMDAARDEAADALRRELEAQMAGRLAEERLRVERVCAEFARDRQRYFAAAETQVVKLALAIARKVLSREVAADPMHLSAVVKAALGRVQDGSVSVLRARAAEVENWRALLGGESVEVVADGRVEDVVLETSVGRVELGVEVQMEEIERGFAEIEGRGSRRNGQGGNAA